MSKTLLQVSSSLAVALLVVGAPSTAVAQGELPKRLSNQSANGSTGATVAVDNSRKGTVSPGPLEDSRRDLLARIQEARSKGIGITSYMAAFSALEDSVKAGQTADQLKPRLQSLSRAIEEQLSRQSNNGDVEFGPYMADLQRHIKKHWFPPKGYEAARITVGFKVHSEGKISGLHLVHSCGVAMADNAALRGVQDAAPFRPLPNGAPSNVDIQFTFDYNVFAGSGSRVFRQF